MFAAFKSLFTAVRDLFIYPSEVTMLHASNQIGVNRKSSVSSDGEILWAGGGGNLFKVNTSDFSYRAISSVPQSLLVVPTPDGANVLCGQSNTANVVYKVNVATETYSTYTFPNYTNASIWDMQVSPDSQFGFFAVSDSGGYAVYKMRLSDGGVMGTFRPAGTNEMRNLSLTPDGESLYVGRNGGSPNGWIISTASMQPTSTLDYDATALGYCTGSFSPDGLHLYATGYGSDGYSKIYKFTVGDYSTPLVIGSIVGVYKFPVASPDGKRVYINWSDNVKVLDAENLTLLHDISVSGSNYHGVSVSPDGLSVYSVGASTSGWYKITAPYAGPTPPVIYAATSSGLSISTDGGISFVNRTTSDGLLNDLTLGVVAVGSTVYAATLSGLCISTDGGETFTTLFGGVTSRWGLHVSGSTIYSATTGGVYISTDGGASFTTRTTADGLGSNNCFGLAVSGSTVCAATSGGLSISTDGGATFTNRTTADGLGGSSVRGVHVDGSTVYAATTSGLSISTDGGATFTNRTTADGLGDKVTMYRLAVSGSTLYVPTNVGLSISASGGESFTNRMTVNGLGNNTVHAVFTG